jgi:hypothetical protein
MRLADARQSYYDFSQKASDIVRQLGFAGIALIWLFKTDVDGRWTVPVGLLPAVVCIVTGLAFDLLHYVVAAVIWGAYARRKEKTLGEAEEFKADSRLNWPSLFFYYGKIAAMVTAYVIFIIPFVVCRLR